MPDFGMWQINANDQGVIKVRSTVEAYFRHALTVFIFMGFACASTSRAQDAPSAEDIVRALTPSPTRGGVTRSLRGVEVEPAAKPASIDLYVNFKYDSAELESDALAVLRSLGTALRSDQLAASRIEIVGHTDGKGSDAYNQTLSERRASAVRNVLVGIFDIADDRLSATGRGEGRLKDDRNPEAAINRRVEIRKLGGEGR